MDSEHAIQRPCWVIPHKEYWKVLIWAQPCARKTHSAEIREGRLKIRIAAPAVENKANKELMRFVAKQLQLKVAAVELLSGETGRQKTLLIKNEVEPQWSNLSE